MQATQVSQIQDRDTCRGCAIHLMRICAQRSWWFLLIREPLAYVMRLLARWHGIAVPPQSLRVQSCEQCMKPMKMALLEKSALFRFGNRLLSPWFSRLRASLVTAEEIEEAKRLARESATRTMR